MTVIVRDKKWDWKNSLWMLWAITLFCGFISFLWIGPRAKQMKWTLFGFLYLVVGFGSFVVSTDEGLQQVLSGTIIELLTWVWLITAIICLIHALSIRKDYLDKRWQIISTQRFEEEAGRGNLAVPEVLAQQSANASFLHATPQLNQSQPKVRFCAKTGNPLQSEHNSTLPSHVETQAQQQPKKKLNLNSASEQELATLPGVSVALAKRAISLKESNGEFTSPQDFCKRLGIMPHFAVQIEEISTVDFSLAQSSTSANTGRVIDI